MWDTMGELWIQAHIATTFWYNICAYLHSQLENYRSYVDVLHIKKWLFYYQRCLFSVLELDARYESWVIPSNMHCSLFLISHFCIYSVLRDITWKLQVICGCSAYWTTARDPSRELWPETYICRSLRQHCVHILQYTGILHILHCTMYMYLYTLLFGT